MKRIRGLLVASTLGLAAVDAPLDDTITASRRAESGGMAVTTMLDVTEAETDANGGPASDRNPDDIKPRRRT